MKSVPLREWLLPGGAERDEAFYQEILSLSHRGLLATGALEIAIGCAAVPGLIAWQAGLALLATGSATLAFSRA